MKAVSLCLVASFLVLFHEDFPQPGQYHQSQIQSHIQKPESLLLAAQRSETEAVKDTMRQVIKST